MKIEEISKMWAEDSNLDHNNLITESVNSVKYHSKYYDVFVKEKLRLVKMEQDRNILIHQKTEYFMGELDQETLKSKGWMPFQKRILKTDLDRHMSADKDIIENNLSTSLQREKVQMLKDIIAAINQRTFHIKNIIEFKKFQNGEF